MTRSTQTIFGKRLREARERAQIPQDKLGVMIGIDESSSSARISRYETGSHSPPFRVAAKLADALKIPTIYLYCEDDDWARLILALGAMDKSAINALFNTVLKK